MGGGTLSQVKTQSAKIYLNFNFRGGWGDGGWYSQPSQNSKCQDLPKFQFSGGGQRGWCYSQPSQNSKCQDLPKFQFSGREEVGWGGWYSQPSRNSKCQDHLNFNFWGGEGCVCVGDGGTLSQVKTQSVKICLNFNFRGGGWVGGWWYSQPSDSKCQELPKFQFSGGGWGG